MNSNQGSLFEHDPRIRPKYEKNGYAATPGTGPDQEKCSTCQHSKRFVSPSGNKVFYKCGLMKHLWTHSYRTDIKITAKACREWESK